MPGTPEAAPSSRRGAVAACYVLGSATLLFGALTVSWGVAAALGVTGAADTPLLSSLMWVPWTLAAASAIVGEIGPHLALGGDAVAASHGAWQKARARRLVLPGIAVVAFARIVEGAGLSVSRVPLVSVLDLIGFFSVLVAWPCLAVAGGARLAGGRAAVRDEAPPGVGGDPVLAIEVGYALPVLACVVMMLDWAVFGGSDAAEQIAAAFLIAGAALGNGVAGNGTPETGSHAAWQRSRARRLAMPCMAMVLAAVPLDFAVPRQPGAAMPCGLMLASLGLAGLLAVWPAMSGYGASRLSRGEGMSSAPPSPA